MTAAIGINPHQCMRTHPLRRCVHLVVRNSILQFKGENNYQERHYCPIKNFNQFPRLGCRKRKKAGPQGQPSVDEVLSQLESESRAQFTPKRMWDDGAGWIHETDRMTKRRNKGSGIAKVIAVVRAIGQVECLPEELEVHAISELDVLLQAPSHILITNLVA